MIQFNAGRGRNATNWIHQRADIEEADVVCVQEPCYSLMVWAGWTRYGNSSSKAITMVNNKVVAIALAQFSNNNVVAIRIGEANNEGIIVANVYAEPDGDLRRILNHIEGLLRGSRVPVVLLGDLNAKHQAWGSVETDNRGSDLMDLIGATNLEIGNNEVSAPTFETVRGRSWIDVCFSRGVEITGWKVDEENFLSDHKMIDFIIRRLTRGSGGNQNTASREMVVSRADWDLFSNYLQEQAPTDLDGISAEEAARILQSCAIRACEVAIPTRTPRATKAKLWWNAELQQQRTNLRRARRRAQDPQNDVEAHNRLWSEFRTMRLGYKKNIKEAKITSLRRTLSEGSPDDPWGMAHRIISARKKNATAWETVQDQRGQWTEDRATTAAALIEKYFPLDDAATDTPRNQETRVTPVEWNGNRDLAITIEEIEETIRGRPKRKAPGIDGFPAAGLQPLFQAAGAQLQKIFNSCLQEGIFPQVWKRAKIAWLPKPHGGGLRPICLLPTIGKVFDKVLATRLSFYLEKNGLLSDRQFGFRRGRGTTEALKSAVRGLKDAKAERKHALLVALDIKNAFNSAWYPKLKRLIASSGCPMDLGRTICNFLEGREVVSEGIIVQTERGCPQGSCLGPVLWLLIMEDWFKEMDQVEVHPSVTVRVQAFADDQLIQITGPSTRRIEAAWDEVWRACRAWALDHKLDYAPAKTTAIFAGFSALLREPRLDLGTSIIEPGNSMLYLGVVIDRKLLWIEHMNHVRGKIAGAGHRIRAVAGKTWGTDPKVLRAIYLHGIRPALLYGAEVWGERSFDSRIQKHLAAAQRPFLLGITRAYRTTSNAAIQVLAGCMPLHLEALARHSKVKRMVAEDDENGENYEGGYIASLGQHPASPRRMWTKWEDDGGNHAGAWIFTDASRAEANVGAAVVMTRGGEIEAEIGWRLQDEYPVHMAEIFALSMAAKAFLISGAQPEIINFATDARVALDAVCNIRSGGVAQRIRADLKRIEERGTRVKLWWAQDNLSRGMKAADQLAKKAREELENFPPATGKVNRKWIGAETRKTAMAKWQQEWETSTKGRLTNRYLPMVAETAMEWSPRAVYLLTGHGPFKGYFNRFHLRDGDGQCLCDTAQDTAEHAATVCTIPERENARLLFEERQQLIDGLFPFRLRMETGREEIRNFNRFAEEVTMEEEEEAIA